MGVAPMTLMEQGVMAPHMMHSDISGGGGGVGGSLALRRKTSGRYSARSNNGNRSNMNTGRSSIEMNDGGRRLGGGGEDDSDGKEYLKWVDAFSYAAVAGVVGAISILLAGLTSKTVFMAFAGNNHFNKPTPWIFIICMVCTLLLQTKYLNSAMQVGGLYL